MSTIELKNKLKEKIDALNEDYLLEELLSILELESTKSTVFNIPEEHKSGLKKSLQQMDEGLTTSHDQVMKELRDGLAN
jgi:predicted house-cleaning noncanonical NTP pyrophosphatase (MazG superfamily)